MYPAFVPTRYPNYAGADVWFNGLTEGKRYVAIEMKEGVYTITDDFDRPMQVTMDDVESHSRITIELPTTNGGYYDFPAGYLDVERAPVPFETQRDPS